MGDEQKTPESPNLSAEHKNTVAVTVLIAAGGGIVFFATVALLTRPDKAMEIFNALLPVLGTWVGTVLAYYFTKENFSLASQSVAAMARQTVSAAEHGGPRSAKDRMLPRNSMVVFTYDRKKEESTEDIAKNIKIDAILKKCDDSDMNRLPVLDKQDRAVFVINRKHIDQHMDAEKTIKTLHDFFTKVDKIKKIFETVPTVKPTDTLAEAKKKMEAEKDCRDVMVTVDGTRAGAVVGWLTDSIIRESAKA